MNNRLLLFLAILIILIGVAGLFFQQTSGPPPEVVKADASVDMKVILVANAEQDLDTYDIIQDKSYKIRAIEVAVDLNDPRDITDLGKNLNGFLVKKTIKKGGYILPGAIESPGSDDYIKHSLREDEFPYVYPIGRQEEYLLSLLSPGKKTAIYLKFSSEDSDELPSARVEGSGNNKNIAMKKIAEDVEIIWIKDKRIKLGESTISNLTEDSPGSIILRVNGDVLSTLKLIENYGKIIITPEEINYKENMTDDKRIEDILPHLKKIRALRGDSR